MVTREWHKAHDLVIAKKYKEAEIIYSNIFPKLKRNGRFGILWKCKVAE